MPRSRNRDPAGDNIRRDMEKPLPHGHRTRREEIPQKAEELADEGLESRKRRY